MGYPHGVGYCARRRGRVRGAPVWGVKGSFCFRGPGPPRVEILPPLPNPLSSPFSQNFLPKLPHELVPPPREPATPPPSRMLVEDDAPSHWGPMVEGGRAGRFPPMAPWGGRTTLRSRGPGRGNRTKKDQSVGGTLTKTPGGSPPQPAPGKITPEHLRSQLVAGAPGTCFSGPRPGPPVGS